MHFVRVCATAEVAPSTCREFEVGRRRVLICEYRGGYYARAALCPHRGNPLDGARLVEGAIVCPWHGYSFDVVTGENRDWEPIAPLRTFALERRGDELFVAFPSDQA
ncbi:MAG TPA: Rieske (2Fe-2S) protein [Candidatus Nitrosotalea sp.]|nr:Rieske (2Fe-2S) protein [Candidatus Nitrosotalea sp.]